MIVNTYWKPRKRTYHIPDTGKMVKRHNKTYRGSLTKRNKQIREKRISVYLAIGFILIAFNAFADISNSYSISGTVVDVDSSSTGVLADPQQEEEKLVIKPSLSSEVKMYREFTAYNAGDPRQCDSSPCISASGDNICTLLAQGQIIFASNEFPLGTKLYVEGIGEGIVLDRMNSRFKTRIDLAMQAHEKPRAIAFGLQTLSIKIIK